MGGGKIRVERFRKTDPALIEEIRAGKVQLGMLSASDKHMYQPGLLYLALGRMTPDELYREWGYTALTRHREEARFYVVSTGTAERALPGLEPEEDQLVDEMIFSFTHTQEMPWILPGVPPTNRHVEVPLVAIVRFRQGKLAHEHIYWDQASVLVQIGLLETGKLPITGVAQARKLTDQSLPSNEMMTNWPTSADKPL